MSLRLRLMLSVLSGVLVIASFPFYAFGFKFLNGGIIAFVALAPLFVAIWDRSVRATFALVFASACVWYLGSLFWFVHAMNVFGGVPILISIPLLILAALVLAAFISLAPVIAKFISTRFRGELLIWMPAAWVAVELLRNYFPCGGFPWSNIAMSQWKMSWIVQIADVTGVYGVIFLIVIVNGFIAESILKLRGDKIEKFIPKAIVTAVLLVSTCVYGVVKMNMIESTAATKPTTQVALIQGNISQDTKWKTESAEGNLNAHRRAVSKIRDSNVDLIVWPESSFPWVLGAKDNFIEPLALGLEDGRVGALPFVFFGVVTEAEKDKYYNSAFLADAQGNIVERYNKVHLAPFGEYVPYRKVLFFAKKLTEQVGDFIPGDAPKVLSAASLKFAPLICYEDIFPEISRKAVMNGAMLIVNVTNNAWFGKTSAPYQQLALSVYRAVENRRYLLRSTNTGVSAVVSPTGKLVLESPMFEEATIIANVRLLDELTIYTKYGDWFAFGCAAYVLLGLAIAVRFAL